MNYGKFSKHQYTVTVAVRQVTPNFSGFVMIGDYCAIPACWQAVEDFRAREGIQDKVYLMDWTGVYWRKS